MRPLPLLALALAGGLLAGCAVGSDDAPLDGGDDAAKETGDATGDVGETGDSARPDADASDGATDTKTDAADAAEAEVDPCPGKTSCAGKCVDTTNDVDHCGKCDNPCPDRASAVRTCVASICGFACNVGYDDCNGIKLDGCETSLDTSVANCGLCGKVCPGAPNADPKCTGGTCGTTCKIGWGDCDATKAGCETDTTVSPSHCGGCGKACPSGPTTDPVCGGSTCGTVCKSGFGSASGFCTNMGGAFATQSGCGGCANSNPYTSGCSCPTGFVPGASYLARTDTCGITASNIQFCESTGPAAGVWGGAFQVDDAVSCSLACRVTNPKTGACSCPSGYTAQYARVLITNSCGGKIGSRIGICVHPSVSLDNYGGSFQIDDSVSGGIGCRMANTRTGGCSCPSGFAGYALRTLVDSSAGEIGAQLFHCLR